MDWSEFWTILIQVGISAVVVGVVIAFLAFAVAVARELTKDGDKQRD